MQRMVHSSCEMSVGPNLVPGTQVLPAQMNGQDGPGTSPCGPWGSGISGQVALEKLVVLLPPVNPFVTTQELPDHCRIQSLIPRCVYPGVTPGAFPG